MTTDIRERVARVVENAMAVDYLPDAGAVYYIKDCDDIAAELLEAFPQLAEEVE